MQALLEAEHRKLVARSRQYEPTIRSFVRAALGQMPDPKLGMPLLDPEDAASLPVRIEVFGTTMATGEATAGIPLVSSSASRGAVRRTIGQLRFRGIRRTKLWRPEDDYMSAPQVVVNGNPQLTLDTGGFSGAVINKLAFSPDGRYLVAAGDVVRICDLHDGRLLHTLRGQMSWDSAGGCTDLAFSADGRQLLVAAAGFEQGLRIYDFAAPEQIREVHAGHKGHIERLAISRDGQWLVTYGTDRRMQIWNWSNREIVATYPAIDPIDHLSFPTERPNVLIIAGNGNYEWMATVDGETVNSQSRSQLERRLSSATKWPHDGSPHPFAIDLQWSRDRWLAAGYSSKDGEYHYWCGYWADRNAEPSAVHEHPYYVTACALSPDANWAASADALGNVVVWNTSNGESRHEFDSAVGIDHQANPHCGHPRYVGKCFCHGGGIFGRIPQPGCMVVIFDTHGQDPTGSVARRSRIRGFDDDVTAALRKTLSQRSALESELVHRQQREPNRMFGCPLWDSSPRRLRSFSRVIEARREGVSFKNQFRILCCSMHAVNSLSANPRSRATCSRLVALDSSDRHGSDCYLCLTRYEVSMFRITVLGTRYTIDCLSEVDFHLRKGKPIQAVKAIRDELGCSLMVAKRIMDTRRAIIFEPIDLPLPRVLHDDIEDSGSSRG